MKRIGTDRSRRWFVAWLVTVAICAATVSAELLVSSPQARVAGVDLSAALGIAPWLAALAVVVTSVRWIRAVKARRTGPITVRELRELAGRR